MRKKSNELDYGWGKAKEEILRHNPAVIPNAVNEREGSESPWESAVVSSHHSTSSSSRSPTPSLDLTSLLSFHSIPFFLRITFFKMSPLKSPFPSLLICRQWLLKVSFYLNVFSKYILSLFCEYVFLCDYHFLFTQFLLRVMFLRSIRIICIYLI